MTLTVRETKAGSRPAGGYSANTPTLSRASALRTDTILRRPVLRPGPGVRGKRISRGSTVVVAPLRLRPRTIVP